MKNVKSLLLAIGILICPLLVKSQKFDPGPGNTILLIGQTFKQEYNHYRSGTGLTPAGSSHYGTLFLGNIEQGDDNPNAQFLDYVRSIQNSPYALVALSIKDNTIAGGYGQMINPAWGQFSPHSIWSACKDINAGKWDSKIDQLAQTFASRSDVKFFVRVGYEVSLFLFAYKGNEYCNDWLTAKANAGINVFEDPDKIAELDRQAYINAYNHIAKRIRQKASNVAFVYHPVRGYFDTKWLYPGDQYVDYVGFSIFNNDVCVECNGTFNCQGKSIDPELQKSMNFAKSHGKPLMIAESACQAPATNSPSTFNNYLDRLNKVVVNNDVRVLSYINSDWPAHDWDANWGDSRVEVNSTVKNHWLATFGKNTRYLHSGSTPSPSTCHDGIRNGDETDVDCGGSCPDCNTQSTCGDGIQNGQETGIDCGGPDCPDCPTGNCPSSHPYECGGNCYESAAQAASAGCGNGSGDDGSTPSGNCPASHPYGCGGNCYESAAQAASAGCTKSTKNYVVKLKSSAGCPSTHPYECGGRCFVDEAQAISGGCTNGPVPTCNDGKQNGDETGIDCGGSCQPCIVTPTCSDGIQNGDETGIDCGGSCPDRCPQPTCSDGIRNGDETGIDCGGSCPNNCPDDPLAGAKLLPPNKKILLSIGQDLKTELDYINGGVQQKGFPTPGAVIAYTSFHTMDKATYPQYGALGESPNGSPYEIDINWGAGPLNARKAADGYTNSALVIALNIADGGDPGDVWCSGCLSQIGNGGFDSQIRALAAFCNRRPNEPIYLRIGFEFDGKWNLGYSNTNNFKNAWRRIVDVMRQQGVKNVAYVWQSCASPIDDILEGRHENVEDWWPGDNYVDWIGMSWFLLPNEKPGVGGNVPTQKQLADELVSLARRKNKPVMICESTPQGYDLTQLKNCNISSVWDGQAATGCVSKSADQIWNEWFTPYFNYIYDNSDVIRHVTYINVNWEDDTSKFGPGSNYAEGYWGRAGVHVNSTIASKWKAEISKSIWMHGSPNSNSGNLKSAKDANQKLPVQSDVITIVPNPSVDFITIGGIDETVRTYVYSASGTQVLTGQGTKMNVSGLKKGTYILKTANHKSIVFIKK